MSPILVGSSRGRPGSGLAGGIGWQVRVLPDQTFSTFAEMSPPQVERARAEEVATQARKRDGRADRQARLMRVKGTTAGVEPASPRRYFPGVTPRISKNGGRSIPLSYVALSGSAGGSGFGLLQTLAFELLCLRKFWFETLELRNQPGQLIFAGRLHLSPVPRLSLD